jgi:hypothetical protein
MSAKAGGGQGAGLPIYNSEHRRLMQILHPSAHEDYSEILSSLGEFRLSLAPGRYEEVQTEIMNMINSIMRNGKVKSVMFRQFVVQK